MLSSNTSSRTTNTGLGKGLVPWHDQLYWLKKITTPSNTIYKLLSQVSIKIIFINDEMIKK